MRSFILRESKIWPSHTLEFQLTFTSRHPDLSSMSNILVSTGGLLSFSVVLIQQCTLFQHSAHTPWSNVLVVGRCSYGAPLVRHWLWYVRFLPCITHDTNFLLVPCLLLFDSCGSTRWQGKRSKQGCRRWPFSFPYLFWMVSSPLFRSSFSLLRCQFLTAHGLNFLGFYPLRLTQMLSGRMPMLSLPWPTGAGISLL